MGGDITSPGEKTAHFEFWGFWLIVFSWSFSMLRLIMEFHYKKDTKEQKGNQPNRLPQQSSHNKDYLFGFERINFPERPGRKSILPGCFWRLCE